MKVFVSGVAGFLGSHLADAFILRGHEVVGCDNMIGGDLQNLPEGIQFADARRWIVRSARDVKSLGEAALASFNDVTV